MATKPQHYWPFAETGDYTDQGTTGGLNLTAEGTGNSFDANGLNLDGNGWAEGAANADIYDLGNTFSIIFKVTTTNTGNQYPYGCTNWGTDGGIFQINNLILNWRRFNPSGVLNDTGPPWGDPHISSGVPTQVIMTQSGGYNNLYVDSVLNANCPIAFSAPVGTSVGFAIGSYHAGGGINFIGVIEYVGVLKGEGWSAEDVADIFANGFGALPLVVSTNYLIHRGRDRMRTAGYSLGS